MIQLILVFGEKRTIFATLDKKVKDKIDISSLPKDYASAISLKLNDFGFIIVDFIDDDLEVYKDLDSFIFINPMQLSESERESLNKLFDICPNLNISDDIGISHSTVSEYINGEKWINQVLENLNPQWSNIEKIAFIDNAIGKKISYSPDFDTEIFDAGDSRSLWKIIDSGYGVCNGIAQLEHYIFNRVGIESEMISSKQHSFLKLNNIEIPLPDGSKIIGNTILDPTWNLAAHKFSGKPNNFCRSYEEIRTHDIRDNGDDSNAHKNDEKLSDATLDLPEPILRKIFTKIGLADKDGNFPIKDLIEESKNIDNSGYSNEQSIQMQFELLKKYCPDFASCINSTSAVLEDILLANPNLNFSKCVVNRVYSKDDSDKKPVLYVYVDLPQQGNKFYFADQQNRQFIELPQKEFEDKFECYETDLLASNGIKPWKNNNIKKTVEDLTKSSGKIVAAEGEEK